MRASPGIAAAVLVVVCAVAGSQGRPASAEAAPKQETPLRTVPIAASAWTGVALLGGIMVAGVLRRRKG